MKLPRLLGSIACTVACSVGNASVCAPTSMSERVYVALSRIQEAIAAGNALDAVSVEESVLRVRLRSWQNANTGAEQVVRLTHNYGAHRIDARISMPTNGHLHRLGMEWRRHSPNWEVAVAPTLAASSNAGRHPRVLDANMVDWHASVRRIEPLAPSLALLFGICRDGRRGDVRIQPSAAIRWQPHEGTEVLLGYPDSRLHHRLSPSLRLGIALSPSGGAWHAFDRELTNETQFARRGWRLEAELALRLPRRQQAALAIGIERQRALEFDSPPGTGMSIDVGQGAYLSLRWRR
ncbi:MAG: hypothetical protein F4Y86_11995 [Gammaproteobacteria bacterium]|nr:hypothetical protein [Gammaproteobacteria bacterium]MYB38748.1 hypothetical protein [Gammaproteobacteria bacterium]